MRFSEEIEDLFGLVTVLFVVTVITSILLFWDSFADLSRLFCLCLGDQKSEANGMPKRTHKHCGMFSCAIYRTIMVWNFVY